MKKIVCILLIFAMAPAMAACRRRITADSPNVAYETVYQPNPVPMEGEGQQVPDSANEPDPQETKTEIDANGERVDETIAAQGGETVKNGEDAKAGEKITVTLDAMGGECEKTSVTLRAGGVYGVLPTPTRSGHTFQGWFLQADGGEPVNPVTVVLQDHDHTLYAHWTTKTEFVLTFDPNGGRISPYSATKNIYSGDVYGRLPEPMRSGFAFLGWFTQPEGGERILPTDMVTVVDDTTLYAHWEYDPQAYWAFVLENTAQRVFTCQEVSVYLELEADGFTMPYCPLISDTGANNIARYEKGAAVSDDWVKGKNPHIILKLTDNMASSGVTEAAMERRFPGCRVYVLPVDAVEGSENEQLYWKLRLAALCYPEYYSDVDMNLVASELGVEPGPMAG